MTNNQELLAVGGIGLVAVLALVFFRGGSSVTTAAPSDTGPAPSLGDANFPVSSYTPGNITIGDIPGGWLPSNVSIPNFDDIFGMNTTSPFVLPNSNVGPLNIPGAPGLVNPYGGTQGVQMPDLGQCGCSSGSLGVTLFGTPQVQMQYLQDNSPELQTPSVLAPPAKPKYNALTTVLENAKNTVVNSFSNIIPSFGG